MRSGSEYLEALSDGRAVFLDGERVKDVTAHPAFAPAIKVIADTYDNALAAAGSDDFVLSEDPETGERFSTMWRIPRSSEDLIARRKIHELWAKPSYGLMGRTPDHVASLLSAFAGSASTFARGEQRFAENVLRFHAEARRRDLYVSYVIVPPQVDRSKPAHQQPEPFLYAGVCDERDDGVVIRGAQMIGTSAVMSDMLLLTYIVPLQPGDEDYAISAVMPCNSPGLRIYPRRPYASIATSTFDYPLSSRFDEADSLIVFDDVFVPWENVFVYRDIGLVRDQFFATGAHLMANFQALCRFAVKLRFAAGLAMRLTELHSIDRIPPVQAALGGDIASTCATFEALIHAAEGSSEIRDGMAVPNPKFVYTGMALQRRLIVDLMRALRELAGGSFISVPSSERSFSSPETAAHAHRYYRSATATAVERVKLLKLLWDFVGTEFAGRQLQYEMFYSAAQHISDTRVFHAYDWDSGRALVETCLDGYGMTEGDLSGQAATATP